MTKAKKTSKVKKISKKKVEEEMFQNISNVVAIVKESNEKTWIDLRERGFKLIADYDSKYDLVFYEDLNKYDYKKPQKRKSIRGLKRFVSACKKLIVDFNLAEV